MWGADKALQEYNTATNKKYLTEQDIKKALKAYPYQSVHQQGKGDVQLACFSKFPILSIHPGIEYEKGEMRNDTRGTVRCIDCLFFR